MLFWATIGGIAVFIGLLLEKFAEWVDERFLGGTYKPHKTLESIGWCVLMLGILIEIGVAGWSANDAWETKQAAIKNDPLNQPITSVTARAWLWVISTNGLDFVPRKFPKNAFVTLKFGNAEHLNKSWPECILACKSAEHSNLTNGWPETTWVLEFDQNSFPGPANEFELEPKSARYINGWDTVELDAIFLPKGTEIAVGSITVTVNSAVEKRFDIPSLKMESPPNRPLKGNTVIVCGAP